MSQDEQNAKPQPGCSPWQPLTQNQLDGLEAQRQRNLAGLVQSTLPVADEINRRSPNWLNKVIATQDAAAAEAKKAMLEMARDRLYGVTEEPATKHDAGKPQYDLIPPRALEEVAKVFSFGAAKYKPRAWETGLAYGRIYAAILRHLVAFWRREDIDRESGLHHLAHAAFGCLAIVEFYYRNQITEDDDRPKWMTLN